MLLVGLRSRATRGVSTNLAAQASKLALQLAGVALLSRLVAPHEFGLYAMAAVVVGLLGAFQDGGLSAATVQRPDLDHGQVSALFWINAGLGAGLAGLGAAIALVLPAVFGQPDVLGLGLALSASFLLLGPSIQPLALMRRRMLFGQIALIEIVAIAGGVATAGALALAGWGPWSLVAMSIVGAAITTLLALWLCRWCPGRPRRAQGVAPLLGFGWRVMAAKLGGAVERSMAPFAIGMLGGAATLGHFNRANTLAALPGTQLTAPLVGAAQPVFARIADDPARFRHAALALLRGIAAATALPAFLLIALADPIVRLALGPGWDAAIPYLRLLAIGLLFEPVCAVLVTLLVAVGRPGLVLRWRFVSMGAVASCIAVGSAWGPLGIAAGLAVAGPLRLLPLMAIAAGPTFVGPRELVSSCAPAAACASATVAALLAAEHWTGFAIDPAMLLPACALAALFYSGGLLLSQPFRADARLAVAALLGSARGFAGSAAAESRG